MHRILVSLVSEQTIPNVELIREMGDLVDHFLFITTNAMESRGNRNWIVNTACLKEKQVLSPVIVNPFSFENIEERLTQHVNDDDFYIVNLTGGTKVMSLAVYEFFKVMNSEMYYLTGRGEKIKIHPGRKKVSSKLATKISLKDYLSAYGFRIKKQSPPIRGREITAGVLTYFLHHFDKKKDISALKILRENRSKGIKSLQNKPELQSFLDRLSFKPDSEERLSKYECRYLSGEWLEEYLYYFIIDKFDISDQEIGMGLEVEKSGTPNEFDVLLVQHNRIFLFECKTSIYLDSDESQTLIGQTIYKSDSLRNKFGLFAQTTVVTLSDLTNPKLIPHLERAEASRVKLLGNETFLRGNLSKELDKL